MPDAKGEDERGASAAVVVVVARLVVDILQQLVAFLNSRTLLGQCSIAGVAKALQENLASQGENDVASIDEIAVVAKQRRGQTIDGARAFFFFFFFLSFFAVVVLLGRLQHCHVLARATGNVERERVLIAKLGDVTQARISKCSIAPVVCNKLHD